VIEYLEWLRNFRVTALAFAELLGVYFLILGIALAGLVTAQRKREREKRRMADAESLRGQIPSA
jgi:hypothetical protein